MSSHPTSRATATPADSRRPGPPADDPITRRGRFGLPAPEDPGRRGLYRPNRRFLYALLAVLAVLAVVRVVHSGSNAASGLAKSCTTPAFAIRGTSFPVGGFVKIAVTGPSAGTYVVYLDVQAVTVDAQGQVTGTPYPGVPRDETQLLVESDGLAGCFGEQTVQLAVAVPAGPHTLGLFRANPDHSQTRLQTIPITVT